MPKGKAIRSRAQLRFWFAKDAKKARKLAHETKNIASLPERVLNKKSAKKKSRRKKGRSR